MRHLICFLTWMTLTCSAQMLNGEWLYRPTEALSGTENPWKPVDRGAVERGSFSIYRQLILEGLPDPYRDANEKNATWIDEKTDWDVGVLFDVSTAHRDKKHVELVFDGLDTFAEVYLNEKQILEAENSFRTWIVPIESTLKSGKNELLIRLLSPGRESLARYVRLPAELPENARVTARKVQMQFGWDFAPRLLGSGLRFPVLQSWNDAIVRSSCVVSAERPKLILGESVTCESAVMQLEVWVEADREMEIELSVSSLGTQGNQKFKLNKGLQKVTLPFTVKNPALWWTNGQGAQALHTAEWIVSLPTEKFSGKCIYGVRDFELIREKDGRGESFRFKLNGKDLFARGANLVPASAIDPLNTDDTQVLLLAREAGMNCLRVWGGGHYASDRTLELCDKYGILIWQDLPFGCGLYPWDEPFLANVEAEVADQARRLRGHASLALWCGNNECDEGWWNWGWSSIPSIEKVSDKVRKGYETLFEKRIPQALKVYDPGRPYISTSPRHGGGRVAAYNEGDLHDWGLWHGREPFSRAPNKTGRFVSEFGFQSFPAPSTLTEWIASQDRNDPRFANHQKQPVAYELIGQYMGMEGLRTVKPEQFAYATRWLQAEALRTHISAHRLDPDCAGSLIWQMNDPWPGISWSLVDFNGVPKPAYYAVKRAFANEAVDLAFLDDRVIAKTIGNAKGVRLALLDINGKILFEATHDKQTETHLTASIGACYALAESGPHRIIRSIPALFRPTNANIGASQYTLTARKGTTDVSGMTEVTVEAQGVVIGLSFEPTAPFAYPSDALFDLLPGEKQIVRLRLRDPKRDWRESFKVMSWHDLVVGWGPLKPSER